MSNDYFKAINNPELGKNDKRRNIEYWNKQYKIDKSKTESEMHEFIFKYKKTKEERKRNEYEEKVYGSEELKEICSMPESNDVDYLGEGNGYKCYKINSVEASIRYGLYEGGNSGHWCISGWYGYQNGESIYDSAEYYYNDYTDREIEFYFFIGKGTKYAIAVYPEMLSENKKWSKFECNFELFNINDTNVADKYDKIDLPLELIDEELRYDIQRDNSYTFEGDFVIKNGVLYKYEGTDNEVTIPNGVTKLGDYCFRECTSLKSITIPNGVTELGGDCFAACESLTSITIPNSVTKLGDYYFGGCKSLTSIEIPNGVTKLYVWCFGECENLTSITIPNSVTKLCGGCFCGCKSLTNITIPDSVTELGDDCFYKCTSLTVKTSNQYVIDYCENNDIDYEVI